MSITFIAATSASTSSDGAAALSIGIPAGSVSGDLLVAVLALATPVNTDVNVGTVPSGWSLAGGAVDVSSSGQGVRVNVYTRFVNGTEGSTFSWGASGVAGRIAGSILSYRGVDGIPSGNFITALQTTSSTSRPTGQITVGQNTRLVTIVSDVVGASQTFSPADVTRITVNTPNVGFGVGDSNGGAAVGTATKTSITQVASDVGVNILFGLHAAQTTNSAPSASAGTSQSVAPGSVVTLAGSATDLDGSIASVQWSQDSGTATTIANATSYNATVTPTSTGTYVYRFTAFDNLGASAASTVTITVASSPQSPPTASAKSSDSIYYLVDATTSTANHGGTLSYQITPSALSITTGKWLISPASTLTTYTVTVTEAGVNTTAQATVAIPAAGNSGGSNVPTTGVQTVIFQNGAWS